MIIWIEVASDGQNEHCVEYEGSVGGLEISTKGGDAYGEYF